MSSLQKDFHKAIYTKITDFIEEIHFFAEQPELQEAYISLPAGTRNGRTFEQVILDDLMGSFASVMHDVPDKEIPVSFYQQLLAAREGRETTEAQAKTHLIKALADKRKYPSMMDFETPEFLQVMSDAAPGLRADEFLDGWISVNSNFGSLLLNEAALAGNIKAQVINQRLLNEYGVSQTAAIRRSITPTENVKKGGKDNKSKVPAVVTRKNTEVTMDSELAALLKKFAKEVTAEDLPDKHGREEDVKKLSGVLLREKAPYIVLHGEEGVGKSTVVQALAKKLNDGKGPGHLKNGKIYRLSLEEIVFKGGRDGASDADKLIRKAAEHNRENPDNPIILYIDDYGLQPAALEQNFSTVRIHLNYAMKDSKGALIIAELTDQQMFVMEKQDKESLKRFQKSRVEELSVPATVDQLKMEAKRLEKHHGITIPNDAIDHILRKTSRYMPAQFHPAKDLDILQAAAAQAELDGEKTLSDKSIDLSVANTSKLPLTLVGSEASDRISNVEKNLNKQIFGQEHATKEIGDTLSLVNQGLQDPKKPLGVFYLTGKTGVGKTAIVKALADVLFADESALIRINLGDFQEKHTVSRITGAPPGYVGYGEKTALEDISEKPFSVVLVDEAEKGHPDVDNVLMNIMDEGELTLLNGKKLNFRNAVIIFTSNLGASAAEAASEKNKIGFTSGGNEGDVKEVSDQVAKERLKPEFRNRATFIGLHSLTEDIVKKITVKEVENVSKRLRDNKLYAGVKIDLSENALRELMSVGFDAKLGARPMQRALQTYLTVPLGKWLETNTKSLLSSEFTLVVKGLKSGLDVAIEYSSAPEQNNNKPASPKVA